MKNNEEFYKNLYVKYFNWIMLPIMLVLSIFTFNHFTMFIVYGCVLCALSYFGFKQYIFDIVAVLSVMVLTAIQYALKLNYMPNPSYFETIKQVVAICAICTTFANFFLVRHNYKVFVLKEIKEPEII